MNIHREDQSCATSIPGECREPGRHPRLPRVRPGRVRRLPVVVRQLTRQAPAAAERRRPPPLLNAVAPPHPVVMCRGPMDLQVGVRAVPQIGLRDFPKLDPVPDDLILGRPNLEPVFPKLNTV